MMKASLPKFLGFFSQYLNICFLVITLAMLLSACQTNKVTKLNATYYASIDLNPDINARPSPLVVNIYQLKSLTPFRNLDFFSLNSNPKMALGDSLLFQEQIEIRPNQVLETELMLSPDIRYLAFVAAYRNIEAATWQTMIPLKSIRKKTVKVFLSDTVIEIKK
jgi:type VI secretion system protein VasD